MKYLLPCILFPLFLSYAQDDDPLKFFPHKTGDMWEYRFSEFGEPTSWYDTLQIFTIFDSTDSKGIIHITQYARRINPIEYPLVIPDTARYWIDTVNHYVYGRSSADSFLLYKLNAQKGEQWIDSTKHKAVKVKNKWEDVIFGRGTTFMEMEYYDFYDVNDTLSWLGMGTDVIADGFGLVHKGGVEATSQEISIIGAVINGIYYGDTTLVSVKDNKNFLPLDIKLYQNYPNPFNPSTTISFELSERSNISLVIYDVLGKEIYKIIDNNEVNAGAHKAFWNGLHQNGTKAASGVYFYRLVAKQQTLSHFMILLK